MDQRRVEDLIVRLLGALLGTLLATVGAGAGAFIAVYLEAPTMAALLAAFSAMVGGLVGVAVTTFAPNPKSLADLAMEDLAQGRSLPVSKALEPLHALQRQAAEAAGREGVLMQQAQAAALDTQKANARLHAERQRSTQAQTVRTVFLTRMSHELRTPLNAVIGYSEMVSEELDDPDLQRDLLKVRRAGLHLKGLVTTVLDLSQLESGQFAVRPEAIDLYALVTEVVEGARNEAETNQTTLVMEVDRDASSVADRRMVESILFNLIHNAVKFTARGEVTVVVRIGEFLELDIADTGIGMTPRQVEQAFIPFEQGDDSTTRRYDGAGLGLAICRGFAEAMGGGIAIESEVGQGAKVTVTLPRVVVGQEPEDEDPDEPTMILR